MLLLSPKIPLGIGFRCLCHFRSDLIMFALVQPKQKDVKLGQRDSKTFECLKMLLIKALFKFTDLYISI